MSESHQLYKKYLKAKRKGKSESKINSLKLQYQLAEKEEKEDFQRGYNLLSLNK